MWEYATKKPFKSFTSLPSILLWTEPQAPPAKNKTAPDYDQSLVTT